MSFIPSRFKKKIQAETQHSLPIMFKLPFFFFLMRTPKHMFSILRSCKPGLKELLWHAQADPAHGNLAPSFRCLTLRRRRNFFVIETEEKLEPYKCLSLIHGNDKVFFFSFCPSRLRNTHFLSDNRTSLIEYVRDAGSFLKTFFFVIVLMFRNRYSLKIVSTFVYVFRKGGRGGFPTLLAYCFFFLWICVQCWGFIKACVKTKLEIVCAEFSEWLRKNNHVWKKWPL